MAESARISSGGVYNGRWTDEEHRRFVTGLSDPRCGRDWRRLAMIYVRHALREAQSSPAPAPQFPCSASFAFIVEHNFQSFLRARNHK